jgi:hypothetical protein
LLLGRGHCEVAVHSGAFGTKEYSFPQLVSQTVALDGQVKSKLLVSAMHWHLPPCIATVASAGCALGWVAAGDWVVEVAACAGGVLPGISCVADERGCICATVGTEATAKQSTTDSRNIRVIIPSPRERILHI